MVMATGKNTTDANGSYHTSFKLGAGVEDVYLSSNLGYIVDRIIARYVDSGNTIGKTADGETYLLKTATPGAANAETVYNGYTQQVVFSAASGYYDQSFNLTLSVEDPDAEIYYTLDFTTPNKNSTKYTEPIKISKDATVSAIAISPNKLRSETATHSYILERAHDLPIVVLTFEPDNLYGSGGFLRIPTGTPKYRRRLRL